MEQEQENILVRRGYKNAGSSEVWKRTSGNRIYTIVILSGFQKKVYEEPFYGKVESSQGKMIAWATGVSLKQLDGYLLFRGNRR